MAQLQWSSPSTPKQIIPQSQLYSRIADRDGDGMPDLWEQAFDFNPDDPSDATADADGDGVTNLPEYLAGTNPLKAAAISAGLPAPWFNRDIGQVGRVANGQFANGVFVLSGAGADIWGNADGYHFVYRTWKGDGQIVARIVGLQNTDPWAKAGVMMRESLRAEARHATMVLTPENGAAFQHRVQIAGKSDTDSAGPATAPQWVKVC